MNAKELKKFEYITENANYGIAMSNLEGEILYLNKYFAESHGYSVDELIGSNFSFWRIRVL